jgi:hypothetical protein
MGSVSRFSSSGLESPKSIERVIRKSISILARSQRHLGCLVLSLVQSVAVSSIAQAPGLLSDFVWYTDTAGLSGKVLFISGLSGK